jgi:hypothetical protein
MLYVLGARVRVKGNTRQKWFRGDRDDRGSCFARGTHGKRQPHFPKVHVVTGLRRCIRQGHGGYIHSSLRKSHVVGRKLERPDEMLNGSKATEASARFVMPRAAARVQQRGRICREVACHSSFATE